MKLHQMNGVPSIRGLRSPVSVVIGTFADGMNTEEILTACPGLEADDIRKALQYAAEAMHDRESICILLPESPALSASGISSDLKFPHSTSGSRTRREHIAPFSHSTLFARIAPQSVSFL